MAKVLKGDERHVDGCDMEFKEDVVTRDTELPPAKGGVEIIVKRQRIARRRR